MKITTYPMLHIGHKSYYNRLSDELPRCKFILHEGVSWRLGDKRRPMYDLIAKNFGLVAQENALRYPDTATKINLDMDRLEFRAAFYRLPLKYLLSLMFIRRILWIITLPKTIRRQFVRYNLLRPRRSSEIAEDTPLNQLILKSRDKRIVENLTRFLQSTLSLDQVGFTGIIFGAGHMPAIRACLRKFGYHPGTERWVEIFRKSTSDDGIA